MWIADMIFEVIAALLAGFIVGYVARIGLGLWSDLKALDRKDKGDK